MDDETFNKLLKGQPATLEQFKDLYDTQVYDLKHAVRLKDWQAVETVTRGFDNWLRGILDNTQTKVTDLTESKK